MKAKGKIARTVLIVVLSVLLAASAALAFARGSFSRVSADDKFSDIIRSEDLTLQQDPANCAVPDTMDKSVTNYMGKVFNLGFTGNSPYAISSLSQGYESAAFASVQGTKYAEGVGEGEKAFYISGDMVTSTEENALFTSAGTTMSFSKQDGTGGGYFMFDFKMGGEMLDAAIPSDKLFGLLGTSATAIGIPGDGDVTGHFNTAQLFYKVGAIETEEMNDALRSSAGIGLDMGGNKSNVIYIAGESLDDYNDAGKELKRAAWITDGNSVATSSVITQREDGWYQARIPVGEGAQSVSLGLTIGTTNLFGACVDTFFAMAYDANKTPADRRAGNVKSSGIDSYFVIRNVDFKGNTDVADKISVTAEGIDSQEGLVTAQVDGMDAQTSGADGLTLTQSDTPFVGKKVHLTLDESKLGGKTFYGWDVGGEFYGGTESEVEIMQDETVIKAICGEPTAYEARIGTTFYPKFDDALTAANKEGGVVTVTVPRGGTLDLTDSAVRTIEKGVTVVLPYDASGKGYTSGVAEGEATRELASGLAWQDESKYRNMTVDLSGQWQIAGTLTVGGVLNAPDSGMQSRTSGDYAELHNSGTLTVSGTVNVYGRITGEGTIDVQAGGAVAEPFLILDFTTGENAADAVLSGLLDRINGNTATTPFLRYALVNVENTMNIVHGGHLNGFLSLYALGRTVSFDQPIVGTKDDNCFMMLESGASVQISYEKNSVVSTQDGNCTEGIGKTKMNFTGGADIGALTFTVFGVTFDSNGFVFSIPYNFDITLGGSGAEYHLLSEFMVMPGASLTLGEGSSLEITHTFWTLEGYQADPIPYATEGDDAAEGKGKYYPSADELATAGYSKSGNFIVNGNLTVDGTAEKPIAFLGIVQTTGSTGKMTIGENVDLGLTGSETYSFEYQAPGDYTKQYPSAEVQFNADSVIFIGKLRQAQEALAKAEPHEDLPVGEADAEAAARAMKFFVLISPARVYDGFGRLQQIKEGNTYSAKRGDEWSMPTFSYQYFNDLAKLSSMNTLNCIREQDLELNMRGGWVIDHEHTEGEEPDIPSYVDQWERGFYLSEREFDENEPCKPVVRYHNALGCEEMPDTKLLVNSDWVLHVPYTGYPYSCSMNEPNLDDFSLYDIIKSSFFQHIVTAYPDKIDWAQNYINGESFETDEMSRGRFSVGLDFKLESSDGGDICEPGEYTLNVSFLSNKYKNDYSSWDVSCAWFSSYDEEYGYDWDENGTIKVVVDPIPLLSAEDEPERWEAFGGLETWQTIIVKYSTGAGVSDLGDGLPAGTRTEDITIASILVRGMFSAAEEFYEPFWETYPFLQYYWEVESYEDEYFGHYVQNNYIMENTAIGNQRMEYEKEFTDPTSCIRWDDQTQEGGELYLIITGDGTYFSGTYKFPVKVRKTALQSVEVLGTYTYEGEPIVPIADNIIVKDENNMDVPSSEYDVEFQNNEGPGEATIIVTAKPESVTYEGTVRGFFTITIKKGVLKVNVSLSTPKEKPYGISATLSYTLDGIAEIDHYYTRNGEPNTRYSVKESVLLKKMIKVTSEGTSSTAAPGMKYDIKFEIDTDTPYKKPSSSGGGAMSVGQFSPIVTATGYIIDVDVLKQIIEGYEDIIFVFDGQETSCNALGDRSSGTIAENAIEVVALDLSTVTSWQFYFYNTRTQAHGPKATVKNVTYDGEQHGAAFIGRSGYTLGIQLTLDGSTINIPKLSDVLQYDYGDSDRVNVGTVNFKLIPKEDNGGFIGALTGGSFVINPADVTVTGTSVVGEAFTYNGQAQMPTLKAVYMAGETETEIAADQYTMTFMKDGQPVESVLDAGEYTVTIASKGNYTFAEESVLTATFTVAQAEIASAQISVEARTYCGTAQTLQPSEVTVTLFGITGEVTFTIVESSYQNNTNAGTATFTIQGSGNFTGTAEGSFVINRKAITVKANDISGVYGDAAPQSFDFTVQGDGLVGSDDESALSVTLTLQSAEKYVVGTEYTISGSGTADNYIITVENGKYTLSPKTVNVTIQQQTVTYSAAAQAAQSRFGTDWTVEEGGLVHGDDASVLNVTLTAKGACKDAGSYDIEGAYSATNYIVDFGSTGDKKFVINKKDITVTANGLSLSEGATKAFAQGKLTFHVDGLLADGNDVEAHIKVEIDESKGAFEGAKEGAKFTLKVSFADGYEPKNYAVTKWTEGELTITSSVFGSVVFDSGSAEYDGAMHTLTATGSPEGASATYTYYQESSDVSLGSEGVKDAGSYRVVVIIQLDGYSNYERTATLKITPKAIEIQANSVQKVYGEELLDDSALTFTLPDGALVAGDESVTITASLSYAHNRAADDYVISGTATASTDNYTVTVKNGTYHISKKTVTVTILTQHKTYTGSVLNADSTEANWTVDGLAWDDHKSVLEVVLTGSGTAAGSYQIEGRYKEDGNYVVNFEGGEEAFVIDQMSVEGASVQVTGSFVYTGSKIEPTSENITVTLEGFDALTFETDFTLTYGENTAAGEGTVVVHGKGNFQGTVTGQFTIDKASIADAQISLKQADGIVYNGKKQEPEITVTLQGFESQLLDYTTVYGENINAGDEAGSVTVNGQGNFQGTASIRFKIEAATLTAATVTGEYTYTGTGIEATVDVTAGTLTGLARGTDYTVTYQGNTDAGENAVAEVHGTGNYQGTVTAKFTILPKDIASAGVTVKGTYTYSGSAILPQAEGVEVTLSGYTVTFTLRAENNVDASTQATLYVQGIGNFTGTVKRSFTISPKPISVTLLDQEADYSGKIPTPDSARYTVDENDLCLRDGKRDELGVEIEILSAAKDAARYVLTMNATNKNYKVSFNQNEAYFTIHPKQITVKANSVTARYGDALKPLTFTAEGVVEGEAVEDVIKVTLRTTSTVKGVGTYTITGSDSGSSKNYSFTVEEGTYTVDPKEITITIRDQSKMYDGKEPAVPASGWDAPEGAILSGDNLRIVLTKAVGVDVKEGGYAITGEATDKDVAKNYSIDWVDGTYTILPRTVHVAIEDQTAVYNYEHNYAFSAARWHIAEGGDGLAAGEDAQVLGILLSTDEMTDVGSYAIRGTKSNGNYTVVFEGAYASQDADNGHAGVYSVTQLDISASALFLLSVEGNDVITESLRRIRVTFVGDTLVLSCQISVNEGEEEDENVRQLKSSISPRSIDQIGEYTVTVTIEDVNYAGSTQFTVVVVDADGYTKKLKETLARLEEIAGNMTAEELTVEDFETLKEVDALIGALDESEVNVAGDKLARYEALVERWEKLADLDDTIETAETVANAPIATLFGAAAALTALAALCFVIRKGGLL